MTDTQPPTTAESPDPPISPIKERSQSLLHALEKRPDPQELLERNILHAPPGVSYKLQKKQVELEKAMTASALKRQLERRPERQDLIERNILHATRADAGVQAQQRELERSMLEDHLSDKLKTRPKPEDIVQKGILNPDDIPTHA